MDQTIAPNDGVAAERPGSDFLEGYVLEEDYARRRGASLRTCQRDRQLRQAPPYIQFGRRIYYRIEAVREWLVKNERAVDRTPAAPPHAEGPMSASLPRSAPPRRSRRRAARLQPWWLRALPPTPWRSVPSRGTARHRSGRRSQRVPLHVGKTMTVGPFMASRRSHRVDFRAISNASLPSPRHWRSGGFLMASGGVLSGYRAILRAMIENRAHSRSICATVAGRTSPPAPRAATSSAWRRICLDCLRSLPRESLRRCSESRQRARNDAGPRARSLCAIVVAGDDHRSQRRRCGDERLGAHNAGPGGRTGGSIPPSRPR